MKPRGQTFIPGTEPPAKNPGIETALQNWLNAKADARDASEKVRIRHLSLLERMAQHGVDRYPFVDERTGKKKHVVGAKETKAKIINAPKEPKHKPSKPFAADGPADVGEEVKAKPPAEHSDPFGSTRRALDEKKPKPLLDEARDRQKAAQ